MLDGLALADAVGDDEDENDVAAGVDDEEDEEELHAAAVKPTHTMPSTAAARQLDDRNVSMMPTIAIATCVSQ